MFVVQVQKAIDTWVPYFRIGKGDQGAEMPHQDGDDTELTEPGTTAQWTKTIIYIQNRLGRSHHADISLLQSSTIQTFP